MACQNLGACAELPQRPFGVPGDLCCGFTPPMNDSHTGGMSFWGLATLAAITPQTDLDQDSSEGDDGMVNESTRRTAVGRCALSGKDVGRMIEIPGSEEWKIECPSCGTWWHGGSTVLVEHELRGERDGA